MLSSSNASLLSSQNVWCEECYYIKTSLSTRSMPHHCRLSLWRFHLVRRSGLVAASSAGEPCDRMVLRRACRAVLRNMHRDRLALVRPRLCRNTSPSFRYHWPSSLWSDWRKYSRSVAMLAWRGWVADESSCGDCCGRAGGNAFRD